MLKSIRGRELLLVSLFFLLITGLFFWKIIFTPGMIVGHDWMLPYTNLQMERYLERPLYTWIYDMNLLGVKNPFFIQLPFMLLTKTMLILGLGGEALSKTLILTVFTFSGTSVYFLLRYLGLEKISSLVGGFMLISSPVFFNYSVMGWCFVLFSIGIMLPLSVITFIKSVSENKMVYAVLTGLLFSAAIIQSQSLVWFPLVFLALSVSLIKDRQTLVAYVKSLFIVGVIALALHLSWWPNLFIYKDPGVSGSDLALDSVSLGMRSRLSYVNILRGWGSLFNNHFEISYPKSLVSISFLIPILAILSLLAKIKIKKDLRYSLLFIIFYMFIFYTIDPAVLARIPFSNIIRDTARFTAMMTFAYVVLASITINNLFLFNKNRKHAWVFYLLLLLICINATPFITGQIFGETKNEYDVRMRNIVFPEDYSKAEKYLYTLKNDFKVYYPPSGTNIGMKNQPMFDRDFKEIKDPFRGYSPFPGTVYMYYSSMGKPSKVGSYLDTIFEKKISQDDMKLLGLMNIQRLIIRDDILYPVLQTENIENFVSENQRLTTSIGGVKIVENKSFIPHFYVPDFNVYSPNDAGILPAAISIGEKSNRPAIYTENENLPKLSNSLYRTLSFDEIITKADAQVSENNLADIYTKSAKVVVPRTGQYSIYINSKSNINAKKSLFFDKKLTINSAKSMAGNDRYFYFGKVSLSKGSHVITYSLDKNKSVETGYPEGVEIILKLSTPQKNNDKPITPKISFSRINTTKYRVDVTGAKSVFNLVFLDSFHDGWQIFPTSNGKVVNKYWNDIGRLLSKTIKPFVKEDAQFDTMATYFDGQIKELTHGMRYLDSQSFESWGVEPIAVNSHLVVNGYANSWSIDPQDFGNKENFSFYVELVTQRNFYIGLFISILFFLFILIFLIYQAVISIRKKA